MELDQCLARWQQLDEQQRVLDEAVVQHASQSAEARLLLTLPGAGAFMALDLAAPSATSGGSPARGAWRITGD